MDKNLIPLSKFISLVLRHRPEVISINLDRNGWCDVNELILKMKEHGHRIDLDTLKEIVLNDNKQRYSFNKDYTKIRANQGHSIKVDLDLKKMEPPKSLYHGTVDKFIESIMIKGLQKKGRQHVHLSEDITTARIVGKRRGKAIVLQIDALKMHHDGYVFYKTDNNVWLCDHVPKEYIEIKKDAY